MYWIYCVHCMYCMYCMHYCHVLISVLQLFSWLYAHPNANLRSMQQQVGMTDVFFYVLAVQYCIILLVLVECQYMIPLLIFSIRRFKNDCQRMFLFYIFQYIYCFACDVLLYTFAACRLYSSRESRDRLPDLCCLWRLLNRCLSCMHFDWM